MASGNIIGSLFKNLGRTAVRSALDSAAHQRPNMVSGFRAGLAAMPQTPSATSPTRLSAVAARNFQAQHALGGYSSRKMPGTIDIEALQSEVVRLNTKIADADRALRAIRFDIAGREVRLEEGQTTDKNAARTKIRRLEEKRAELSAELKGLKEEREALLNKTAVAASVLLESSPRLRALREKYQKLQERLTALEDAAAEEYEQVKESRMRYDKIARLPGANPLDVKKALDAYLDVKGPGATGPFDNDIEKIQTKMESLTKQIAMENPDLAAVLTLPEIGEDEGESGMLGAGREEITQSVSSLLEACTDGDRPISRETQERAANLVTAKIMEAITAAVTGGKLTFSAAPRADNTIATQKARRDLMADMLKNN